MTDANGKYPNGHDGMPRTLEAQKTDGERRFSPSVERNHKIIAEALLDNIANSSSVLELGSGTGEHGVYITKIAADLSWTFSDYNEDALPGISAWIEHAGRDNLKGPYQVDAASTDWGRAIEAQTFDVLFSANMIHISSFSVAQGLFAGAARLLPEKGHLVLYGPFARDGKMVESNASFDADLKRRNADWGVRDIERDLLPLAKKAGLDLQLAAGMPANNQMLIYERV